MNNKLILASSSPRRFDLLTGAGFEVQVVPANIEEQLLSGETPLQMVKRLAQEKALQVARQYPGQVILAGDTTVVLAGENLGKPIDAAEACAMLKKMQGEWHTVYSAICVVAQKGAIVRRYCGETEVRFVPLSADEISKYVATGEPLDKAGSYGIQEIGAQLIAEIKGSYTNVVGLDLAQAVRMLKALGVRGLF